MSYIRKYIYILLAGLTYLIIHEGVYLEYMNKFLPGWRVTKDELNGFIMDKY